MRLPADDEEIAQWVRSQLTALDTTPRQRRWRARALGMSKGEALAAAPRTTRIDIDVPIGETRILRVAAQARGMALSAYVRRAVATVLVASDRVEPDAIPWLASDGLIGPTP